MQQMILPLYFICGLTLNTVCSSGLHNIKWMLRTLRASRGGQQSCYQVGKGEAEDAWFISSGEEEAERLLLLLSATSWGREMEKEMLLSSSANRWQETWERHKTVPWVDQTGHEEPWLGMSLLWGWSKTGTGFLARWLMLQACQCSGGSWIMPSVKCLNLW